ncbi:hypothetical protein KSP40_PGU002390 [Platanthera guangdongensis]|uniref:Photosystem I assembly protein Ycf4 n=1 Tax=Platanthera guangdongensis TaxID=2320717 RepID=A0ABR2MFA0_9ASPA
MSLPHAHVRDRVTGRDAKEEDVDVAIYRCLTFPLEWTGRHSLSIFILVASNIVVIIAQGFYWRDPKTNLGKVVFGETFKIDGLRCFTYFVLDLSWINESLRAWASQEVFSWNSIFPPPFFFLDETLESPIGKIGLTLPLPPARRYRILVVFSYKYHCWNLRRPDGLMSNRSGLLLSAV